MELSDPSLAAKEACMAHCSWNEYTPCWHTSYTNSIVAGCPFAGVIAQGYSCKDPVGQSSTNILKNIVAHSSSGSGALVLPDIGVSDNKLCYQISHISAYKNDQAGIATMYPTAELRASNIVLVDNHLGISLSIVNYHLEDPNELKLIKLSDSFVYGEADDMHKDCPDGLN